jgi:hypothetical protein
MKRHAEVWWCVIDNSLTSPILFGVYNSLGVTVLAAHEGGVQEHALAQ